MARYRASQIIRNYKVKFCMQKIQLSLNVPEPIASRSCDVCLTYGQSSVQLALCSRFKSFPVETERVQNYVLNVLIRRANVMFSFQILVQHLLMLHILQQPVQSNISYLIMISFYYIQLKHFLSMPDHSCYVVLDNQKSHSTKVLSGVPQGTMLAPLLILI